MCLIDGNTKLEFVHVPVSMKYLYIMPWQSNCRLNHADEDGASSKGLPSYRPSSASDYHR